MKQPGDQTILIDKVEQGNVRFHDSDDYASQEEEEDESAIDRQFGGGMSLRTKLVSSERARLSASQDPAGFYDKFFERTRMRRGEEGEITKGLGPDATRRLLDLRNAGPTTKSDFSDIAAQHGTARNSEPEKQGIVQKKGGKVILKLPASGRPKATDLSTGKLQPHLGADRGGIPHIPRAQKRVPSGVPRSSDSLEKEGSPTPPTGKRPSRTPFPSSTTTNDSGTSTGDISPAADKPPVQAQFHATGKPSPRFPSQLPPAAPRAVTSVTYTEGERPSSRLHPLPAHPPPAMTDCDPSVPPSRPPASLDVLHFEEARYVPQASSPSIIPPHAGTSHDPSVDLDTDKQSLEKKKNVQRSHQSDPSESPLNQISVDAPTYAETPLYQEPYTPQGDFRHPSPLSLDDSDGLARSSPKSGSNLFPAQQQSLQASGYPRGHSPTSLKHSKTGGQGTVTDSRKSTEEAEKDPSRDVGPTDEHQTEMQAVLLDARKMLECIAAKTKTSVKAVVKGLVEDLNVTIAYASPRSDNDYNVWQKYFYRNQEAEEAKSGVKGCSANYAWNLKRHKDSGTSFKAVLQLLSERDSLLALGNATVNDRKRQYDKLCKRTENLVEDAREQGFHLAGIIVGNRSDTGLGRVIVPSHLPNVWKDKIFVIDEGDAISFLQHYVESIQIQKARDAFTRPEQPDPSNTGGADSGHPRTTETKATPVSVKPNEDEAIPVQVKTGKEKLEEILSELGEDVDPVIICRYALASALEEASNGKIDCGFTKFYADRKSKVATKWKNLPRSLALAGLVLRGYPVGCRYAIEVELDKAKASNAQLPLKETQEAQDAEAVDDDNEQKTAKTQGQGIRELKKPEKILLATALTGGGIWFEKLTDPSAIDDLLDGRRPVMMTGPQDATSLRKARSVYLSPGRPLSGLHYVKEEEQPDALPLDEQRIPIEEQPTDVPVSPQAASQPDDDDKMDEDLQIPSQAQPETQGSSSDRKSDAGATSPKPTTTTLREGSSPIPDVHQAKVKRTEEEHDLHPLPNTSSTSSVESRNFDIDMDGRGHTTSASFPDDSTQNGLRPTDESISSIAKQHSPDVPVSTVVDSQLSNQADAPWWNVIPGPFDNSSALPNHHEIGAESTVVLSRAPIINGAENFPQTLQREGSAMPHAAQIPPLYDPMSWRNGVENTVQAGMGAVYGAHLGFRGEPLIGRSFYGTNQSPAMAEPTLAPHGYGIPPVNPSHFRNTPAQYPNAWFPQINMAQNNRAQLAGNYPMTQYQRPVPVPMQHGQDLSYQPYQDGIPAQGALFGGFGSWPHNQ